MASSCSSAVGVRPKAARYISRTRASPSRLLCHDPPRPGLGLRDDERIVHQDQRLGRHVRHACAGRPWRTESACRTPASSTAGSSAAMRNVNAPPPGAVERAALRPAAPFDERRQVSRHARAAQLRFERAGHGQHRVANALGLEPLVAACDAEAGSSGRASRPRRRPAGWPSDSVRVITSSLIMRFSDQPSRGSRSAR